MKIHKFKIKWELFLRYIPVYVSVSVIIDLLRHHSVDLQEVIIETLIMSAVFVLYDSIHDWLSN
ncbi:MAG: hypothetical protein E7191_03315 [Erysipelotrichaceae bacterium]|nr:hypothetical protein [Erysipelotrichaceae bacterium]MBQ9987759.1 hypothetical protein [Erysipelotrichales bacterium]MBR3694565.1 hypothetical protein [Erysipelotrichales bacterium]